MDIVVLVLQTHDATVIAHGGDIQALREIRSIYYPRMISSYLDSLLHALEYRIDAKLGARGGYAMIHLLEVGELGAKRLAYRLMTQTYAQHRLDACILPDDIHQQPRLGWDSRTRTQYDLIKWLQLAELKLVVAIYRNVHAQLLHQMCQIIGEGIVIIYDYYFHLINDYLQFFCNMNRLGEGAQLVIALFQLILVVALRHDSTACLEPEFAIAADEGSDNNRLVQITIQADESDATAIGSTIVRFQFGDDLHRPHLWRTAQGTGWEGIDELLDVVGILIESSAHTAHQVDDMAIKLHILIEIYLHTMAVAAQVVARQIYQHHVLGILLRVVAEEFGSLSILLHIACATGGSGYRVNKCLVAHDAVVGFRRRAEDAESAEIEIKEIWRWVDAAQGTIELEVIALVLLDEAAADNYLEDIASQTVLDALADVCLVLLVGKGRKGQMRMICSQR